MIDKTQPTLGGPEPLLSDWITRTDLGKQLGLSVDTLARWETRRIGPPCVRIGRKVLYRKGAVHEWLRSQEDKRNPRAGQPGSGGRK